MNRLISSEDFYINVTYLVVVFFFFFLISLLSFYAAFWHAHALNKSPLNRGTGATHLCLSHERVSNISSFLALNSFFFFFYYFVSNFHSDFITCSFFFIIIFFQIFPGKACTSSWNRAARAGCRRSVSAHRRHCAVWLTRGACEFAMQQNTRQSVFCHTAAEKSGARALGKRTHARIITVLYRFFFNYLFIYKIIFYFYFHFFSCHTAAEKSGVRALGTRTHARMHACIIIVLIVFCFSYIYYH